MPRLIITPECGRFCTDHIIGYDTINTGMRVDGVCLWITTTNNTEETGDRAVFGMNGEDADALVLALDAFMVGGDGNKMIDVTKKLEDNLTLDIFDIDLFLRLRHAPKYEES